MFWAILTVVVASVVVFVVRRRGSASATQTMFPVWDAQIAFAARALEFNRSGTLLVGVGEQDGSPHALVWSATTWVKRVSLALAGGPPPAGHEPTIAFDNVGEQFAVSAGNSSVTVYSARDFTVVQRYELTGACAGLRWCDGALVVLADRGDYSLVIERPGSSIPPLDVPGEGRGALSEDGDLLCRWRYLGRDIKCYDTRSAHEIGSMESNRNIDGCVPVGRTRLFAVKRDDNIVFFDVPSFAAVAGLGDPRSNLGAVRPRETLTAAHVLDRGRARWLLIQKPSLFWFDNNEAVFEMAGNPDGCARIASTMCLTGGLCAISYRANTGRESGILVLDLGSPADAPDGHWEKVLGRKRIGTIPFEATPRISAA